MAMPTIPTAQEIKNRIASDLETAIGQSTPWLPKSWNKAVAGAVAGFVLLNYQAILWTYKQIAPDRADEEALVWLGKLVGVTRRDAIAAVITADVAGTNGYTVPTGTRFQVNRQVYQVTATDGAIAGGIASCTLTALVAGDDGNVADDVELAIVAADANLTGVATVTDTTTSGADQETLEQFRKRVVIRYKKRFTGGSPADFELWGLETPHFTWIGPYTSDTEPGVNIIYGKVDNQTDGIPTGTQLNELEDYLTTDPETGKRNRKPTTDELDLRPITRYVFDFEIEIQGGSQTLEAQITEAIDSYLESREPYIEGLSPERLDIISAFNLSAEITPLAIDEGATLPSIVIKESETGTVVAGNYYLIGGKFPKLGTVTYTEVA